MSLQWTLIATFLYVEVALIILLLIKLIKPQFWRSLFRSRFMKVLAAQSNLYLYSFITILLLFFVESIREFHKYSKVFTNQNDRMYVGSTAYYEDQMRLFRGQRNFYISGFALFLLFIIKRLIQINGDLAQLKAEAEASIRQAEQAAAAALSTVDNSGDVGSSLSQENSKLKEKIKELEKKLKSSQTDLEAMKRQTENTNKAFDEVAEKLAKLENSKSSTSRDKKD